ncbi:hypothetical protein HK098_003362 [Nowakowskiella sp. JEL0407]|nr:hypothetical protein HK098_003362 [Nowakowskiella sp. JEL0407]
MSVADILYYLRCLFPSINVNSEGPDGYKLVFSTGIQHKETGFGLGLYEWEGGLTISVDFGNSLDQYGEVKEDCEGKADLFAKDVLELLNIFIPNDEVRFYHPAAVVRPTNSKSPYYSTYARHVGARDGDYENAGKFQKKWRPISANHGLDKICLDDQPTNTPFYRLLCLWKIPDTPPVKSSGFTVGVWSVTLGLNDDENAKVTFHDHYGLSAVKVSKEFEDDEKLKEEFCALVEFLLSGVGPHPYDGLVAGSVA